jgi:hypothetical protein
VVSLKRLPAFTRAEFLPYAARFWSRVVSDQETGCWNWLGRLNTSGYGQMDFQGRARVVHRVAYEVLVGPLPEGLPDLDHLCRNRRCVNPAHMEPVSRRENVRRGTGHTAINMKKTHCIRGHEFSPQNTLIGSHGGRFCRARRNKLRRLRLCA